MIGRKIMLWCIPIMLLAMFPGIPGQIPGMPPGQGFQPDPPFKLPTRPHINMSVNMPPIIRDIVADFNYSGMARWDGKIKVIAFDPDGDLKKIRIILSTGQTYETNNVSNPTFPVQIQFNYKTIWENYNYDTSTTRSVIQVNTTNKCLWLVGFKLNQTKLYHTDPSFDYADYYVAIYKQDPYSHIPVKEYEASGNASWPSTVIKIPQDRMSDLCNGNYTIVIKSSWYDKKGNAYPNLLAENATLLPFGAVVTLSKPSLTVVAIAEDREGHEARKEETFDLSIGNVQPIVAAKISEGPDYDITIDTTNTVDIDGYIERISVFVYDGSQLISTLHKAVDTLRLGRAYVGKTLTIKVEAMDNEGKIGNESLFGVSQWHVTIHNHHPSAKAFVSKSTAMVGDGITFSGNASDPDNDIVLYAWDFDGDGTFDWSSANNAPISHIYTVPGLYTATFMVMDKYNHTAQDTVTVKIYSGGSGGGGGSSGGSAGQNQSGQGNQSDINESIEKAVYDFSDMGLKVVRTCYLNEHTCVLSVENLQNASRTLEITDYFDVAPESIKPIPLEKTENHVTFKAQVLAKGTINIEYTFDKPVHVSEFGRPVIYEIIENAGEQNEIIENESGTTSKGSAGITGFIAASLAHPAVGVILLIIAIILGFHFYHTRIHK